MLQKDRFSDRENRSHFQTVCPHLCALIRSDGRVNSGKSCIEKNKDRSWMFYDIFTPEVKWLLMSGICVTVALKLHKLFTSFRYVFINVL